MATKKKQSKSKPKIKAKPAKGTKSSKISDFELAWDEYNSAMNKWKEALTLWQTATSNALMKYHDACQEAVGTDTELLKKVSSSWEQTWQEIGPEYVKQQQKMFDNIFKETNLNSIKKFNEEWEKFLKTSGEESIKSYQEAIKRFNEAWATETSN